MMLHWHLAHLYLSRGGVAYFTRNSKYNGKATVAIVDSDNKKTESIRYLDENHVGSFVQSGYLLSTVHKTIGKNDLSFNKIVSFGKPYGLRTFFLVDPIKNGKPNILSDRPLKEGIAIYGLVGNKRSVKYVPKNYPIDVNRESISKFNVQIPKAFGTGKFGEIITDPFITKPNEIVTETFINIGAFDSEDEAQSVLKYIKTKFFRALLGIKKTTQDISKTKFELIPLQDFSDQSDIDWTQSISDIDKQLYKKYGLNDEEIRYIEENVKEME